jgi:transposase
MVEQELFTAALGLVPPWRVARSEFTKSDEPQSGTGAKAAPARDAVAGPVQDSGQLDLFLQFPRGARFACPQPGCDERECPVHDTEDKTWRHLNFFQYKAYLHAKVPRVRCPEHGVRMVTVSWARPESGFTLLFEALLVALAGSMPMRKIKKLVGEHDTRLWRIVRHYVNAARAKQDYSAVQRVGVDETAAARGQDYVSVFMDPDTARVLFATPGRDSDTVKAFAEDLKAHGGYPEAVRNVTCDMSVAFTAGVRDHLSNADITFDRFHIIKQLGEAVDKVRRAEATQRPELLRKTRWLWLKNRHNLSTNDQRALVWLTRPSLQLATARAHRWREDFQGFYDIEPDQAEAYLTRWCAGAMRSRLEPLKDFVAMLRRHWDGILAWHRTHLTTGLLEGTNSLIQAAKARARGYRNKEYMITIIYLIAGKLPLPSL